MNCTCLARRERLVELAEDAGEQAISPVSRFRIQHSVQLRHAHSLSTRKPYTYHHDCKECRSPDLYCHASRSL